MAEQILLSIAMLASRKKAEVKRCLDSLRPILERLSSELIIVDTSQDEGVHALCLEYTDRVAEFVWCNDFSKARNVSVEMARGEWYLFIDDDEWFVEYEELIDFFRSGKYKRYGCANYIQRNWHDLAGTFYSDNWVSRIIKLYPQTRFYSKIHEYIAPQVGQCINLRLIANHTGYIAQTEEDKRKRFERNYPLLLEMMKEEPQRLRWRVQIIQELLNVHKWEEMRQFCSESLEFCRDNSDKDDFRDIGTFYSGLLESLLALGEYESALRVGEATLVDSRTSRLCRVYNSLLLAQLHFRRREWNAAEEQLAVYFDGRTYFEKHPKELEIQEGALLVDTALDEVMVKRALSLRIGCALMRGDTSVLERDYGELGWEKSVMYVSDDLFPVLVEAFATLPDAPILDRAMQDLWRNKEAAQKLFAQIEGFRGQEERFRKLLRMSARMEGEFWYIWYAKLFAADWDNADVDYTELFCGFCRRTPDVFMTPDELEEIVKRHGGSVEEGYLAVPCDEWRKQIREYAKKVPLQEIQMTERALTAMQSSENVRYDYARLWLARARVLKGQAFADIERGLEDYAARALEFARRYFKEWVLEEYPELMPKDALAGVYIGRALRVQYENSREEVFWLDQAARLDDELSAPIVRYLQQRETERKKRARQEKEEFRQLEIKIKAKVQRFLETGRFAEALEILSQLREMKPNDLDVVEMQLRARLGACSKGGQ